MALTGSHTDGSTGHVLDHNLIDAALAGLRADVDSAVTGSVILAGTGIDLTGATDSTAALRTLFTTSGATRFVGVPGATYKIALGTTTPLGTFTGLWGITIDMAECTIVNTTAYATSTLSPVFLVDGGGAFTLTLGDYTGQALADPGTDLGYWGATLVRAINGADGITVDARITHARYGVQTGDYSDATLGACKNFDLRLRGEFCGYPVAAYLADNIRLDIDVESVHRAAYIAGCDDVRGVVRWANIYIAPYAVLVTDAITSGSDTAAQADPTGAPTTSRGSSNVDLVSIDKGSTTHPADLYCAAISLSRVDPCVFRNIRLRASTTATDTISATVHGIAIASTAPNVWSRYAYQWTSSVVLENITLSAMVDHSACTVSSGAYGGLHILAQHDSTNAASVRGMVIDGYHILHGSGGYATSYLKARGMVSPIRVRDLYSASAYLTVDTSQSIPLILDDCRLNVLDVSAVSNGPRLIMGTGTIINTLTGSTFRTESMGATLGGAGVLVRTKTTSLALTGASVTWADAIPAGGVLLGVQGRILTAITGASGYMVGTAADTDRFADLSVVAVDTTFSPSAHAADEIGPRAYTASTGIVVTAKTANFTAGQLRLVVTYLDWSTPTS